MEVGPQLAQWCLITKGDQESWPAWQDAVLPSCGEGLVSAQQNASPNTVLVGWTSASCYWRALFVERNAVRSATNVNRCVSLVFAGYETTQPRLKGPNVSTHEQEMATMMHIRY